MTGTAVGLRLASDVFFLDVVLNIVLSAVEGGEQEGISEDNGEVICRTSTDGLHCCHVSVTNICVT